MGVSRLYTWGNVHVEMEVWEWYQTIQPSALGIQDCTPFIGDDVRITTEEPVSWDLDGVFRGRAR